MLTFQFIMQKFFRGVFTVLIVYVAMMGLVNVANADPASLGTENPGPPTLPVPASSGGGLNNPQGSGGINNPQGGGGINNPQGGGMSVPLINPLGANTTIQQFFYKIIDIILVFALPLIVLYIMFAGFKYVMARGNATEIESATTALTWAVVGGLLIVGAKVILEVIKGTVQSLQ